MKTGEFLDGSNLTKHITGGRGQGRGVSRGFAAVLLFLLLAGLTPVAAAQTSVPPDWPLKPSGLEVGDQFRLLFITSTTRDGTSMDIADYNSHVQSAAAAGHTAIREFSSQFRVVGSTATVDARDNTMTTGTGVKIYWLNGAKVADNYSDFYDGGWDSYAWKNENGGTAAGAVLTGSNNDGTKHVSYPLGSPSGLTERGSSGTGSPFSDSITFNTSVDSFYALSPVFEVSVPKLCGKPTPVPTHYPDGRLIPDHVISEIAARIMNATTFEFSERSFSAAGGGSATITVVRTGTGIASVNYETGDGSLKAASGGYVPTSGTLRFGATEKSKSFTVPVANSSGTFRVYLSNATNGGDACQYATKHWPGSPVPGGSVVQVNPTTPPGIPVIEAEQKFYDVGEGDGTVTVWIRKFGKGRATVDYGAFASGTASLSDFTSTSGTLTFPAGEDFSRQSITVTITDDEVQESDEVFVVSLSNASGEVRSGNPGGEATISPLLSAPLVTIKDDDQPSPPPVIVIGFKRPAQTVYEGDDAVFTFTASPVPYAALPVAVTVATDGDWGVTAGSRTVTFGAGASTATLTLATTDDQADEADGSVTATVGSGTGYTVGTASSASVAVSDNDDAPVNNLPALSVDDATKAEGGLPVMEFTVRLSPPSQELVRVHVSTEPSEPLSAEPKVDYMPGTYDLTFRPGDTERQVYIWIHDDSHDEDPETFRVVLSKAQGAVIGDGVAVGTITNDDPMPAAWLARFGRTVAEQALDGVSDRMAAVRTPGMRGAIAGQALSFDAPADGSGGPYGDVSDGLCTERQPQYLTARDVLVGSSFLLTGAEDDSGGSMAFWGRAAHGSFDGREGTFSLDGDATTGMLGTDYARGRWLVGLALVRSEGGGDYRDTGTGPQSCPEGVGAELCDGAVRAGDGSVDASLMAAVPYAAFEVSERVKLWGAGGYGTGDVTLKTEMGGSYSADTSWSMAAAGLRGGLLAPPVEGSGPALAVTSDVLWTRSSSERTRQLAASDSDVTRLRLGLEGSYRLAMEGEGSLTPKLELGGRHDGGDAEGGFGIELGGGFVWSDPGFGLSLDVSGRTLLAHGDEDLKDRGFAAALVFDPDPATKRGLSLGLRQEFGGQAQGGLDALFAPATLDERTGGEGASRWGMEAAYGFPALGERFTGSPHVGLGLTEAARDYSAGWRLTPESETAPNLSFGLKATRRESDVAEPEHTFGFEITSGW